MDAFRKINNLIGWIIFLIASIVYVITSEPTVSFWDCGEYISTAYKLQVGHPPGAPLFQIIGRFFSLFAFGDTSRVAQMVNIMSALSSSFTILFLFWTITMLAKKIVAPEGEMTKAKPAIILGSGIVGALAYTFTDSFWFSAVEGEVYAMSSFFTAFTFWSIFKWEAVSNEKYADRWLILIAFLVGLSIGVHLLNLLAIPAIALVYYFNRYRKTNLKGIIFTLVISLLLLVVIMYGIIPETVTLFGTTELLFVNTFNLPFHSGTIFFAVLLTALIVTSLLFIHKPRKKLLNIIYVLAIILLLLFLSESRSLTGFLIRILFAALIAIVFYSLSRKRHIQQTIILSFTFIVIGYSSFLMLVIRSNANTPINENSPKDAISLLAYLNREQYGDWPLLYGQYYNTPVIERKDGNPVYVHDEAAGKYVIKTERKKEIPVYDPRYMTFFPRMWNNQEQRYINEYKRWAGIKHDPDNEHIPTFYENLRFFFRYQVTYMYYRYFMWNFAGRQNEIQGRGDLVFGNWLSGIKFIDEPRLGPQDDLPADLQSKARNTYYMIPLLFGLAGMIYHFSRRGRDALVVALLFIMTGIAIVVYLNQHAPQPRERDYAYAASFYAFSIWIGMGVLLLYDIIKKGLNPGVAAGITIFISIFLVPVNLAVENWDDHDRSGRYAALKMAKNYLNSCAPDAILFTNGDNDTFPLWYAQEVEGIRTDVRVCNLSLLNADWYITQMKNKIYKSDPLPISLTWDQYKQGTRDVVYFIENENIREHVDITKLFDLIHKDEEKLKLRSGGEVYDYFPTKKLRLDVDSAFVLDNGTVPLKYAGLVEPVMWTVDAWGVQKNHLIVLDILAHNNWERPVYFSITTGNEAYLGLQDYFVQEGMTYRLVPFRLKSPDDQIGGVNTEVMYDNLLHKFESDIANKNVFVSEDVKRASMNLRNNAGRLAIALVAENKFEKAIEVCDNIIEKIPDEAIPYDFFMLPVADAYYRTGEIKKADRILNRLMQYAGENLVYFFSFTGNKAEKIDPLRQQNLALMQEIYRTANRNAQTEMGARAKDIFDQYYQSYVRDIYNR